MSRLPSDQQQHYLPRRLQVTKPNPCHVTSCCLLMVYIPSMVFRSLSQEAMYLAFLLSSSFVRGGTFSFSFWSRNGNNANVKHAGIHLGQQRQSPLLRRKSAEDKTWLDIIHTQHTFLICLFVCLFVFERERERFLSRSNCVLWGNVAWGGSTGKRLNRHLLLNKAPGLPELYVALLVMWTHCKWNIPTAVYHKNSPKVSIYSLKTNIYTLKIYQVPHWAQPSTTSYNKTSNMMAMIS